jgi:S-(hydroxymethyl)glutathione dehydrogenase/alcohol dehydrogenase
VRAAVLREPGGALVIEDITPAAPGPRDVVVAMGASGVCHSDMSVKEGLFAGLGLGPMVLGHEGVGTVVEVGAQVSRVAPGDRVISSFRPACGTCRPCVLGRGHLCTALGGFLTTVRGLRADGTAVVAMSGLGTFAEQMTCNEASVVRVDSSLPDAQLALLGCGMTTGVGAAVYTARVRPGQTVCVVGCGGVGQAVIQGAVLCGASRIFAVDPVASKRDAAVRLGATDAVDPAGAPADEQVRAATGGLGVDYAFDVVGTPDLVATTYRMIATGGVLVLVGYGPLDAELRLPAFDLQTQEKTVKGCVAGSAQIRRDFPRFVELIERGRLDSAALISQTIELSEVNAAMDAMRKGEVIRSVITTF